MDSPLSLLSTYSEKSHAPPGPVQYPLMQYLKQKNKPPRTNSPRMDMRTAKIATLAGTSKKPGATVVVVVAAVVVVVVVVVVVDVVVVTNVTATVPDDVICGVPRSVAFIVRKTVVPPTDVAKLLLINRTSAVPSLLPMTLQKLMPIGGTDFTICRSTSLLGDVRSESVTVMTPSVPSPVRPSVTVNDWMVWPKTGTLSFWSVTVMRILDVPVSPLSSSALMVMSTLVGKPVESTSYTPVWNDNRSAALSHRKRSLLFPGAR